MVGLGIGVHGIRRNFERWQLPKLYSVHIYGYHGSLRLNGQPFEITPGSISVVPPGFVMEYDYKGRSEALYAHLEIPKSEISRHVPLMRDLGVEGATLAARMQKAASFLDPAHRAAELWSVLWKIALLPTSANEKPYVHPAVRETMIYVDAHLREHLTVPEIASAVRFSKTHLDRVFLAATGVTVSTFVRQRKMETVAHLLQETTQSISSIAASVGISELQAFNKACRRTLGASPRSIRTGSALIKRQTGSADALSSKIGIR